MDTKTLYVLKNAARIARPEYRNKPTWVFIKELMSVGATSAYKICKDLGIDPEASAKNITMPIQRRAADRHVVCEGDL